MSFQFFQNLSISINMWLTWIVGIDKDIIRINNYKDIKVFSSNFIIIAFKTSRKVGKTKKIT